MRKFFGLLLAAVLLPAACCREKGNVVDCHRMAVTVTDKALTIIDRGHYTGACLYSGMADLVLQCGDKAEEEKLLGIIDGLVSGDISAAGGSLISYQVGGEAAAYLAS